MFNLNQLSVAFATIALTALSPTSGWALSSNNDEGIIVQRQQIYHLIQLSIPYEADKIAEFTERTRNIRTCTDARDVAFRLPAKLGENSNVTLEDLPTPLRSIVKSTPVGQATMPFGTAEGGMRVLVVCSRRAGSSSSIDVIVGT